jgi:hypothetical protein
MSKETKIFVLEEMQISLDSLLEERRKAKGWGFFLFFNLFRKFLRSCARICLAVKLGPLFSFIYYLLNRQKKLFLIFHNFPFFILLCL